MPLHSLVPSPPAGGQASSPSPILSGGHTKKLLASLNDALYLETGHTLSNVQQHSLTQELARQAHQTEETLVQTLRKRLSAEQRSAIQSTLPALVKPIAHGKAELSGLMMHLVAWMYLPAAILTPLVRGAYLKSQGVPKAERRDIVLQETGRQIFSGALHIGQCYGSFGLTQGVQQGAARLTHWFAQQAEKASGSMHASFARSASGIAKRVASSLQSSAQKTIASLGLLVLFNTLGYGIIRPIGGDSLYLFFKRGLARNKEPESTLPGVSLATIEPAITVPAPPNPFSSVDSVPKVLPTVALPNLVTNQASVMIPNTAPPSAQAKAQSTDCQPEQRAVRPNRPSWNG